MSPSRTSNSVISVPHTAALVNHLQALKLLHLPLPPEPPAPAAPARAALPQLLPTPRLRLSGDNAAVLVGLVLLNAFLLIPARSSTTGTLSASRRLGKKLAGFRQ
ncbi:hypothetical protein FRC03_003659 [Tulasnella sp. 419]|nr:hypothetical protein FRC03_003659 [Tulasnella sp. 419]